jgi:hypothetical protein
MTALLGKSRVIHHPRGLWFQLGGHPFAQPLPDRIPLPRALSDELLQGLHIAIGQTSGQRLDRFPLAIQQQSTDIHSGPMAALATTYRLDKIRQELIHSLTTALNLRVGHDQT